MRSAACVFMARKAVRNCATSAGASFGDASTDQFTTGCVSPSTRPPSCVHLRAIVGFTTPTCAKPLAICCATASW